ncbi:hypothetical protein BOX15_Mlig015464g1 [Macrostomum lignano]|uniref:Uncharacterized protein n=2 Tax=Macrostomum lignano TaxID=282301 RepID=A0A267EA26_9PLAT|nr:hypothetical protein BOX15_Mlig015464g1 [Macrostomum lignano]
MHRLVTACISRKSPHRSDSADRKSPKSPPPTSANSGNSSTSKFFGLAWPDVGSRRSSSRRKRRKGGVGRSPSMGSQASSCPDDHYLRAARPITVSAEEGAAESAAAALISGGGCFEQEESAAAAATLTSAVTSDRGEDDQAPLDPTAAVGVPAANSDARALSQVPHFDTFLSENGVADLNSDEDALQAGDCGDDNSANNSVPVAPSAEHTYSDIGASSYDDHGSIKLFESVTFDRVCRRWNRH